MTQGLLTLKSIFYLIEPCEPYSQSACIAAPLSIHFDMAPIQTSNYELEIRTKTNEFRYLLVNATTRRNAENRIIGVVGVAQDVTEAAQRDRAVAAMANELRQLVDTANAPIFGIDVHGLVNEWNDKTAGMYKKFFP